MITSPHQRHPQISLEASSSSLKRSARRVNIWRSRAAFDTPRGGSTRQEPDSDNCHASWKPILKTGRPRCLVEGTCQVMARATQIKVRHNTAKAPLTSLFNHTHSLPSSRCTTASSKGFDETLSTVFFARDGARRYQNLEHLFKKVHQRVSLEL